MRREMRLKEDVGGGRALRRRRLEVAKKVRWKKRRLTRVRSASERRRGGREERETTETEGGSERRSTAVGIFARERAREGKRGENKLKAKLYSHKKMELFLDAVPPRYEEKEG